ncbi:ABL108Cp [Eremothecium gossypii ATCC 10895]|uniref:ABL108Cp n=1 Tax=Eremothecium gossypii (strain ATCC 10895 / CBS 109.51 / FGSC 9923 / NRRL Y-1056) TaxID=284811 RepID=Q75DY1_EREGS|nr:ABL108Cp [Eremothecium gossypii ATCC 10895]AAS50663.2 ABL108Cp [Eremothecium gossypii ATCC 10895]AEY94951.1 FABL108Cp [Eremothecium gossypii FDAG1]
MLQSFELDTDSKLHERLLKVSKFPKTLAYWEELLNYLLQLASPLNKSIDRQLCKLIRYAYESMLLQFPYLENYHVDYALFEFKLGSTAKMHKIFQKALDIFNQRSILLWVEYLKLCNEVVMSDKALFKKYETAERYIGLHFYAGEFWEMYLEQIRQRCKLPHRYVTILRKVIEIPLYDYSVFYSLWLQCIQDVKDLRQLKWFAPCSELWKKLKINVCLTSRRGPELQEAKAQLRKVTKELYMVVQYQVMEIYNLFEGKLVTHTYTSPSTLIPHEEITTWTKYLDYTATLRIYPLTSLNFQRAATVLAHYDVVWLKWANWHAEREGDYVSAQNVLVKGLQLSNRKARILSRLAVVMIRNGEYSELNTIYDDLITLYQGKLDALDLQSFLDYVQIKVFLTQPISQSRYKSANDDFLISEELMEIILKRLSSEDEAGHRILLPLLNQMYQRVPRDLLEKKLFQRIISSNWSQFLSSGYFWYEYCHMVWFDTGRSYLERRKYITKEIWPQAARYRNDGICNALQQFAASYSPDDLAILSELFDSNSKSE